MKANFEIQLKGVFLEELHLSRIENNKDKEELKDEKEQDKKESSIELSGKLLKHKDQDNRYKYIMIVNFTFEDRLQISLIYNCHFIANITDEETLNKDEISNELNRYMWPFVTEQVHNIIGRTDIDEKVIIPTYGEITDEEEEFSYSNTSY